MERDDDIVGEIVAFLTDGLELGEITAETALFAERRIDSLQVVDLFTFLEERFKVQVSPERLSVDDVATPRHLAALVKALQAAR